MANDGDVEKCSCKKGFCRICGKCTRCKCSCPEMKKKAPKKKRGRPRKEASPILEQLVCRCNQCNLMCDICKKCITCTLCTCESGRTKIKNKQNKRKSHNITISPDLPPNNAPSRKQPKRHCSSITKNQSLHRSTKNGKTVTPKTLARSVLLEKRKLATPEQLVLSDELLKTSLDESDYFNVMKGTTPPNRHEPAMKTSMTVSGGKIIQTFGDLIEGFGMDIEQTKRKIGTKDARAVNADLESTQPKVFKSVVSICQTMNKKIAQLAYPANPESIMSKAFGNEDSIRKIYNSNTIDEVKEFYDCANQRSVERRVIGATATHLIKGWAQPSLNKKFPHKKNKERERDHSSIENDGKVTKITYHRQKIHDDVVKCIVDFIFSPENSQTLSWGTKVVKLSVGEKIALPNVIRKKSLVQLWNECKQYRQQSSNYALLKKIGRTSFLNIARQITSKQQQSIACVDYVEGNLCNDPIEKIQIIIQKLFDGEERKNLSRQLTLVRNCLKMHFDKHLKLNDNDGFHCIGHALQRESNRKSICSYQNCSVCCERSTNEIEHCNTDFSVGNKAIFTTKNRSRPIVVEIIQILDKGENVRAYKVENKDEGADDRSIIAFHHQLRHVPDIKVDCPACKFPFYFCEHLVNRIKEKRLETTNNDNEENANMALHDTSEELAYGVTESFQHAIDNSAGSIGTQASQHRQGDSFERIDDVYLNPSPAIALNESADNNHENVISLPTTALPHETATNDNDNVTSLQTMAPHDFTTNGLEHTLPLSSPAASLCESTGNEDAISLPTTALPHETATNDHANVTSLETTALHESTTNGLGHTLPPSSPAASLCESTGNDVDEISSETDSTDEVCYPQHLQDGIIAINDSREKFFFFMRHKVRVRCQREYCDNIFEEMKEECEIKKGTSKAFMIIDWKMKFEPMSSRETMPENFGKRGLPWHGIAIVYYEWDSDLKQAIKKVMYIDQIVERSSKQDCLSVIALLEATIVATITNLQNIKEAIICSDNAGCYTSKSLVLMMLLMNAKYRGDFFFSRLIHSETQDGKGAVDRHFAVAMRHIRNYMRNSKQNRIVRINTAKGLSFALQWNNGIQNSIVQYIEIDRDAMETYATLTKKLSNQLKKYYSRASDVELIPPTENASRLISSWDTTSPGLISFNEDEIFKGLCAQIKVRAHPTYGPAICFNIDFDNAKVTPDEAGKLAFERNLLMAIDEEDDENLPDDEYFGDDNDDDDSYLDDCSPYRNEENNYEEDLDDYSIASSQDSDDESDLSDNELELQLEHEVELQSEQSVEELHRQATSVPTSRKYSPPTDDRMMQKNMLTRVIVMKNSYLNRVQRSSTRRKKVAAISVPVQSISQTKDVVSLAVRYAEKFVNDSSSRIIDARDDNLEEYNLAKGFQLKETELPSPGYARRDNGGGDLFGARYIAPYKDTIKDLVDKGKKDKAYKSSPGQIYEHLESEHTSFLLPSLYEIQCYVNQLLQGTKNTDEEESEDVVGGDTTISQVLEDSELGEMSMNDWMKERLFGDIHAKPETIFAEMTVQFPQLRQDEKGEIKKKISSTKSAMKNSAWRKII